MYIIYLYDRMFVSIQTFPVVIKTPSQEGSRPPVHNQRVDVLKPLKYKVNLMCH